MNKYYFLPLIIGLMIFSPFLLWSQSNLIVNGTTGTPLGGFGAGAVKFNSSTGTFAVMTQPPADAYDFRAVEGAKFQFFSNRNGAIKTANVLKAKLVDGKPQDDAIWPLHTVDFGSVNGIQINLKGFSPIDNVNYDNMSLPYVFYEVTLTNLEKSKVDAAFAFQWDSGEKPFSAVDGKGFSNKEFTVFANSNDKRAMVTVENAIEKNGFFTNGICKGPLNSAKARTAVKITLDANETKIIRFVLAWYDDRDTELAYYMNLYKNSQGVAAHGLKQFEVLKANADGLVNRLRASNLPAWLKNQTLNTLANLSTNSMYKRDGRVAFAEGQWTCFGTMDQMWHARQIIGQLFPLYAWQELRYWARTQMKNGQIHHDFNQMDVGPLREKRSVLVSWDDTEHKDYREVLKWVDLNCAMITSTFELYQMTGDKKQFDFLWPYLKKAGQRIFDQVEQYGNKEFPNTFDHSENSYDAGGDPNPFNANFSAVAYKVMIILSKEKGEKELAEKYQKAYDAVVASYTSRYLNDRNFKLGKHAESYFGGQWLSLNMKLGEIWSAANTDYVLSKLDSYYHPYYFGLGYPKGTYDEWTPYILVHHAGLLLNTGRVEQWRAMQKDAYDRQYGNRDFIFDHPLNVLPTTSPEKTIATNFRSGNQYISMPAIWRNYYDLIGYYRDQRTKELWVKPILPAELNHDLKNAMFASPEGYGTISCKESGEFSQNKDISVKSENRINVSTLYLADNFGSKVSVSINGKPYAFKRLGTGYAKELAVNFNGSIDKNGIQIMVNGDAGTPPLPVPEKPVYVAPSSTTQIGKVNPYSVCEAEEAGKSAGTEVAYSAKVGKYITSCNNFDYIQFSNVDFGETGAVQFFAKVASKISGSSIEIVLDNVAGEAVGNCTVPNTGGADVWATISCQLTKVTGIHDVILRFSGTTSGELMDIDKFTFREKIDQQLNPFK